MAARPQYGVLVRKLIIERFGEVVLDVVFWQHEEHHLCFVKQHKLDEGHNPHIRIT